MSHGRAHYHCVCQKTSRLMSAAESHTRKCKNLVEVPKVEINQPEINGEFETQESAKTTCKPRIHMLSKSQLHMYKKNFPKG